MDFQVPTQRGMLLRALVVLTGMAGMGPLGPAFPVMAVVRWSPAF